VGEGRLSIGSSRAALARVCADRLATLGGLTMMTIMTNGNESGG
jgi:hypothetical protein